MNIGIITLYYGSANCGGRLQAFALCKALSKMGGHAEQICFTAETYKLDRMAWKRRLAGTLPYQCAKRIYRYFKPLPASNENPEIRSHMCKLFEAWSDRHIPHSAVCFSDSTIAECKKDYDVLITGSDQVWNMDWYSPIHFLAFAPSSIRKIAYAASVCNAEYTVYQQKVAARHFSDFTAISTREAESVRLLKPLSPIPVEVTLDPTLLLERSDWDEIADARLVDDSYLFCYFLGNDPTERSFARKYAEAHQLNVVVINHIEGRDVPQDREFADIALDDVTPGGFVSLIKHAECVFTDSFHGCVFSAIYQKNVFVFGRSGHTAMSSRIRTVAGLFGYEDHFCDTPEKATIDYIENCAAIDYNAHWQQYEIKKQESIDFLRRNIFAGKDTE